MQICTFLNYYTIKFKLYLNIVNLIVLFQKYLKFVKIQLGMRQEADRNPKDKFYYEN